MAPAIRFLASVFEDRVPWFVLIMTGLVSQVLAPLSLTQVVALGVVAGGCVLRITNVFPVPRKEQAK